MRHLEVTENSADKSKEQEERLSGQEGGKYFL